MLRDDLKQAQISAMKAGEKDRLAAVRLILAKLKDRDIEQRTAATVLLPLAEVVTLPVHTTPRAVEEAVDRTGFSRFPVVDAEGVLSGYLHLKDVLHDDPDSLDDEVSIDLIRPLPSVSENDRLRDVLATLQRTGAHLAIVTDGSGTVLGLVALEDVLEELVGEITDELSADRAA